jgi:3-oxoacyl-[acyl-carrier protein] reductase
MQFKNKTVIITGAGQGIGFEIARSLCEKGAVVFLNDIDAQLALSAAATITQNGGTCIPLAGNCADINFIQQMVDTAVNKFGKLDIVIANAGVTLFDAFLNYKTSSFEQVVQVNLFGSFFLTQIAAKQMVKQSDGGSILLMSSVVGHQAHKNLAAYAMTKAGLEMLAKNLVFELSPHNININAIAPGATITERTTEDKDYIKVWSNITPMGRPASVADIANAALFFVSPASKHITGQSLIIDGGWTSTSPSPI